MIAQDGLVRNSVGLDLDSKSASTPEGAVVGPPPTQLASTASSYHTPSNDLVRKLDRTLRLESIQDVVVIAEECARQGILPEPVVKA